MQRDAGDDQLGRITESGVQQRAHTFPDARGESFGSAADPACYWNDSQSCANEECRLVGPARPEAKRDGGQNEDEEPIE